MAIDTKARPTVLYETLAEIDELVRAFQQKRLPLPRWTHQAHLTVGIWYLSRMPATAAVT